MSLLEDMQALYDQIENEPRAPKYDITFRCPKCGVAGWATGPISTCPSCDLPGVDNWDRGYERVLPPVRFSNGKEENAEG